LPPKQVEQKRIFLNLRENVRGRYLRIAEVTGSNRSTIIIPSSGLAQFRQLLDDFIESAPADTLWSFHCWGSCGIVSFLCLQS